MEQRKNNISGFVLGIDATNLRQGGGITHIVELLHNLEPEQYNFSKVIIWGSDKTLRSIEERPWMEKVTFAQLERSVFIRLYWQFFILTRVAKSAKCDILFVPGGGYISSFRPIITMSRNLLPFDWHEIRRYCWSFAIFRYPLLRAFQVYSIRNADGVIFLTKYARELILKITGEISAQVQEIPHGVSPIFMMEPKVQRPISEYSIDKPYRLIYVSIVNFYKHQWNVVEAVTSLKKKGLPLELVLIGPNYPPALKLLKAKMKNCDPSGDFIKYIGEIKYDQLPKQYFQADLFIFASSCENMPNTLLEGMISGLPIACSNRGPMPEILGDGGEYFDPENPESITDSIYKIIKSVELRTNLVNNSFSQAQKYSWKICSDKTFTFLAEIVKKNNLKNGNRN